MTKTNTVAIVVSADDLNWAKMSGGFIAGARSVNPSIKILFVQIGQAAYADAAGGKRVTASAISGGADIVFGMGDGSSFGMMQAVETATPPSGADKVWFIDVIGDKSSLDKKGIYLSSVVWDFTQIDDAGHQGRSQDGTFGQKSFYLDLDNGMGLLQTQYIPADVWTQGRDREAGHHRRQHHGAAAPRTAKKSRPLIASGTVIMAPVSREGDGEGGRGLSTAPALPGDAAARRRLAGTDRHPALQHHQGRSPACVANDCVNLLVQPRRGALPARRERRRQVDADERAGRHLPAGGRHHPRGRRGRAASPARATPSTWASAWCTSTAA